MKKRFIACLLIIVFLFSQNIFASMFYFDVYNHWAENYIYWASNDVKIYKGYLDGSFRPENSITKAEYIAILFRAADNQKLINEIYESDMSYKDFSIKHWAYTYAISIRELINNKSLGYLFEDIFPKEELMPDEPITREEAAALTVAFSAPALTNKIPPFEDVNSSSTYYDVIKKLYNNGIIEGYDDNTFRANEYITRAESATIINRIFNDMKYSKDIYLKGLKFLPLNGEDVFSLFGNYDYQNLSEMDKEYIKVKNTLEYTSFGGFIFPEDQHLYDSKPIKTLLKLRSKGYHNKVGVNFYLLKYGNLAENENNQLAQELLVEIADNNDLKDSDIMQMFYEIIKCSTQENFYNSALSNWSSRSDDDKVKANIVFLKFAYYIDTNNKDMLSSLMQDENNHLSLEYSDKLVTNSTQSAIDVQQPNSDNTENKVDDENEINDENNVHVEDSNDGLIMDHEETNEDIEKETYEEIMLTDILNRTYVLYYLELYEKAFNDLVDEYKLIKKTKIYDKNKLEIEDEIKGTLKKIKSGLLIKQP